MRSSGEIGRIVHPGRWRDCPRRRGSLGDERPARLIPGFERIAQQGLRHRRPDRDRRKFATTAGDSHEASRGRRRARRGFPPGKRRIVGHMRAAARSARAFHPAGAMMAGPCGRLRRGRNGPGPGQSKPDRDRGRHEADCPGRAGNRDGTGHVWELLMGRRSRQARILQDWTDARQGSVARDHFDAGGNSSTRIEFAPASRRRFINFERR